MPELNEFYLHLPSWLHEFFKIMSGKGFKVIIVGGAPRDWFRKKRLGRDLDIELHMNDSQISSAEMAQERWTDLAQELGHLSFLSNIRRCPFEVIKCDGLDDWTLDLSPPRTEKFIANKISHKNFFATLYPRLDISKAWQRRDFTVNCLGLEYIHEGFELKDPYDGLSDLKKEQLKTPNLKFDRDPVRLLRAIDFAAGKGFQWSENFLKRFSEEQYQYLNSIELKRYWKHSTLVGREEFLAPWFELWRAGQDANLGLESQVFVLRSTTKEKTKAIRKALIKQYD